MINRYNDILEYLKSNLAVGESFDIGERHLTIGNRKATIYFLNGLTDGAYTQELMSQLLRSHLDRQIEDGIKLQELNEFNEVSSSDEYLEKFIPFLDAKTESDLDTVITDFLMGKVPLIVDGLDKVIMIDVKRFPVRAIQEPEKEKTLRGAKDGFSEALMTNINLIRRRVRDKRLIFRHFGVGNVNKTDVALCYMKGVAKKEMVDKISNQIKAVQDENLTACEQTLVERIVENKKGKRKFGVFNPFPKVRYTQRPDIIAAHIAEGKIAIIVDNSPTVALLPVGIFDFTQDIDDYYFPLITGNYLRIIRIINMFVILFLSPIYLAFLQGDLGIPSAISFFVPSNDYAIPVFWQFVLLEIAVDGLKLASLNTPDSLGMSLSVIGALILGEMAIDCGWFVPHTIFTMAVISLASFTIPSIEFSYAMKFNRILMLVGIEIAGIYGGIFGLGVGLIILGMTKNLSGESYLYPLIPLDWKVLKKMLFRTIR